MLRAVEVSWLHHWAPPVSGAAGTRAVSPPLCSIFSECLSVLVSVLWNDHLEIVTTTTTTTREAACQQGGETCHPIQLHKYSNSAPVVPRNL